MQGVSIAHKSQKIACKVCLPRTNRRKVCARCVYPAQIMEKCEQGVPSRTNRRKVRARSVRNTQISEKCVQSVSTTHKLQKFAHKVCPSRTNCKNLRAKCVHSAQIAKNSVQGATSHGTAIRNEQSLPRVKKL